jgi:hypothetical protein
MAFPARRLALTTVSASLPRASLRFGLKVTQTRQSGSRRLPKLFAGTQKSGLSAVGTAASCLGTIGFFRRKHVLPIQPTGGHTLWSPTKGAFILDRELELQVTCPDCSCPGPQGDLILPCVPFHAFFRGFVIEPPISFDHVQGLCVWRTKPVDDGNGPDLEPNCVEPSRLCNRKRRLPATAVARANALLLGRCKRC